MSIVSNQINSIVKLGQWYTMILHSWTATNITQNNDTYTHLSSYLSILSKRSYHSRHTHTHCFTLKSWRSSQAPTQEPLHRMMIKCDIKETFFLFQNTYTCTVRNDQPHSTRPSYARARARIPVRKYTQISCFFVYINEAWREHMKMDVFMLVQLLERRFVTKNQNKTGSQVLGGGGAWWWWWWWWLGGHFDSSSTI